MAKKHPVYDCSNIDYVNRSTPVSIYCRKHKRRFNIKPETVLGRTRDCERVSKTHNYTKERFVERAMQVHGDAFDYTNVVYVNNRTLVDIYCKKHDIHFQLTPNKHLDRSRGCHRCGEENNIGLYNFKYFEKFPERKSIPAEIYLIKISSDSEEFVKIGITQKKVTTKRFDRMVCTTDYTIDKLAHIDLALFDAFDIEHMITSSPELSKFKYSPLTKIKGHTECFTCDAIETLLELLT